MKLKLLDLYCCEGGAARGYADAGFDVVGVDIEPQPRFPFEFHRADALAFLAEHGREFDAIHASPPCQDHSALSTLHEAHGTGWLLDATRQALQASGLPWVMENVVGADMPGALVLCGSEFGLSADCRDGVRRQLRRHRLFESSLLLMGAGSCGHWGQPVGIYGNGGGGQMTRGYKATKAEAAQALRIDWMTRAGLSQALPPAYTQFIGEQLLQAIEQAA